MLYHVGRLLLQETRKGRGGRENDGMEVSLTPPGVSYGAEGEPGEEGTYQGRSNAGQTKDTLVN